MSLDTQQALELLPCYLCGDLPPHVVSALEARLTQDPTLAEKLDILRSTRDLCEDYLTEAPPPLPFETAAEPARSTPVPPAPVPPTQPVGLVLGLAAAAGLLLAFGSMVPSAPSGTAVGELHQAVTSDDARLVRAATPKALAFALAQAGVSPQLALAPDLSAWGFTLVGARILGPDTTGTPPGVAVVYERDGERFVCQIQLVRPTEGIPTATDSAAGVHLRAFKTADGAVVSWFQGGRWCVFGGPLEPDEMLALVKARMSPA